MELRKRLNLASDDTSRAMPTPRFSGDEAADFWKQCVVASLHAGCDMHSAVARADWLLVELSVRRSAPPR